MNSKLIALTGLAAFAVPSFANDLWDQQVGIDTSGATEVYAAADQNTAGDYPFADVYDASDVVVGAGGWDISSISTYVELAAGGLGNMSQNPNASAILNVFANPSSNSLPGTGNDPTTGTVVSVSYSFVFGANAQNPDPLYKMTTTFSTPYHLNAGEYWIGLTTYGSYSNYGEAYTAFQQGNPAGALHESAIINPGGYYGFPNSTGWNTINNALGNDPTLGVGVPVYSAIDIQGAPTPEPLSMAALGLGVVGLIARRRNRA